MSPAIYYASNDAKPIDLQPEQLAFLLRTVEGCILNAQSRLTKGGSDDFYINLQLNTALRTLRSIVPQGDEQ